MNLARSQTEQNIVSLSVPAYRRVQQRLLAIAILLAPLSVTIYLLSWVHVSGSSIRYSQSIAALGPFLNQVHIAFGILASIFLPLGFFGMALLGMKRSPWLATISAIFSLVGWAPFSAIISLDILAYDVARVGSAPQLVALWGQFNGDPAILTYQYIYIIGHMLAAVLLGVLLGRTRLIPAWAAVLFVLSSPLTMFLFMFQLAAQFVWMVGLLWIIVAVPAALAMWQGKGDL